jgi:hypothetical protein
MGAGDHPRSGRLQQRLDTPLVARSACIMQTFDCC